MIQGRHAGCSFWRRFRFCRENWFREFGIPVGGVVVNMLIEESDKALRSEFIANRIKMQRGYCEQIEEDFAGSVRAAIPLFDDEIRGVESLRRMSDSFFV